MTCKCQPATTSPRALSSCRCSPAMAGCAPDFTSASAAVIRHAVQHARQQFWQALAGHLETAGLGVATTAHAGGQRDAVEARFGAQAAFDHGVFIHRPQQRKGARFFAQHVAHQAVKHAGRIDHQAGDTVEHQRAARSRQSARPAW